MNHQLNRIRRLYRVIDASVFMVTGSLDYDRITEATTRLANAVADYPGDADDWLYIGEFGECDLANYIVGAYWHYTEWHAGQWSPSYAALCALGRVFSPGMTSGPEPDTSEVHAYSALESLAA